MHELLERRLLLSAYTLSAVANFDTMTGNNPEGGIVMDPAGNIFGAASAGGNFNNGTVFELNKKSGVLTALDSFNGPVTGASPTGGLLLDAGGNLYGTTQLGGASGGGTVFEWISGNGLITNLVNFTPTGSGNTPRGGVIADSSGNLYGTTTAGGSAGVGTVFELPRGANAVTTLANAGLFDAAVPFDSLTMDAVGNLYGTASQGGSLQSGAIFELAKGSSTFTILASFNTNNGDLPETGLTVDAAGNLYGTASSGGANGDGTVFELVKGSSTLTTLASFNGTDGQDPSSPLLIDAAGNLFGTTAGGGDLKSEGTAFEVVNGSGVITTLALFNGVDGSQPTGSLAMDSAGNIFGTATNGGPSGGTIFELALAAGAPAKVAFAGPIVTPAGTLGNVINVAVEDATGAIVPSDTSSITLSLVAGPSGATLGGTLTASASNGVASFTNLTLNEVGSYTLQATDALLAAPATTLVTVTSASSGYGLTTLAQFNGANGSDPQGGLLLDSSGNLFGSASKGGDSNGDGTVFEVAQGSNAITSLGNLDVATTGADPQGGALIADAAGNLYGATGTGGSAGDGTVFELPQMGGGLFALNSFSTASLGGGSPHNALVLDSTGTFYGTFKTGGANGDGEIYNLTDAGIGLNVLATFNGANGTAPQSGLIIDAAGDLFGTTRYGGTNNVGTVFELPITSDGVITTLASFTTVDGAQPLSALMMDSAGNLYGTTDVGGANNVGTVFEIAEGSGSITTLATFNGTNGKNPIFGPLIMDAAGNLFGSTASGGANSDGTLFEIAKGSGVITTLYSFNVTDGGTPVSGLIPDAAGNLYGTASTGGATNDGTVFALSPDTAMPAPPATQLTFAVPPSPVVAGATITPPVIVNVETAAGALDTNDASTVTLIIASGPPGAALGGTTTVPAVNGVATFSDLSLTPAGDYTLTAIDGTLTPVTTASLTISPAPPLPAAKVAFTAVPASAVEGIDLNPAASVSIEDINGNLIPGDSSAVTLSILTGPSGAVLSGPVTASAVAGVATFSNLTLNTPGVYTLEATDGALAAGTSADITVFAPAAIGGLNPTFGFGGLASHDVGLTSTAGLAVQGDGKSVIAGTTGSSGSQTFGVTRYNADGTLDTTFGVNGIAQAPFPGDAQAAAETLLSNGDILIAGTDTVVAGVGGPATSGSQFALAEFTPAGVLDSSFGNGAGYVLSSFSSIAGTLSNDVAHALAIGPDGTIYVGGSSDAGGHGNDFAIAAYTGAGSPSSAFGTNGKILLDFMGGADSVSALTFARGNLIAAGSATNPSSGVSSVALAEFLPSGALNAKFGVKGKLTTTVRGVADAATSLAIDAKGKIVVGGYSGIGSASAGTLSADFLLLRYDSNGKLDNTFAKHGIAVTSFNQPAAITNVLIDSDGTIVASGKTVSSLSSLNVAQLNLAIARYTEKGQLDTTFNGTGEAIYNLGAVVPQSLAGLSNPTQQPALARLASLTPFDATSDLMTAFNQLTQSDQGVIAMTSGGELLDVGNSGSNTVEAAIVGMGLDLAANITTPLPSSVVGGGKGTASVSVGEDGTTLASGTFTVELFTSSTPYLMTGQTPFQMFPERLKLKEGAAKSLRLKFVYPSSVSKGSYYLVASVVTGVATDLNPANNTSFSGAAVLIAPPFVQLSGSALSTPTFNGAKPAIVSFTLTNLGNVTASTTSAVQFFASTTGAPTGATPLATVPLKLNLKPNVPHSFKLKLALPASVPAGTYSLVALLDPANVFNDPNAAMNFIVSGGTFAVS